MKVGVDATELAGGAVGGVATGVRLLLDALHRHAPELELTAFAPEAVSVPRGVRLVATGGPRRPLFWRRSRQLKRATRDLDVFHSPVTAFPALDGVTVTATVHELPFAVSERLERGWRGVVQNIWLSRALSACGALVAPSHATLRQMAVAHPAAYRVTHVVPHPAPPAPAAEQKGHDGGILFVGRLDRRKNIEALLGAAAAVTGQIQLVGPHSNEGRYRVEAVAHRLGIYDRVLLLGLVDDETLDYLYRRACVVALISVSEGFGFPVLEALARGVPVVVAQGTGAAETGGDAALIVDPARRNQIADALTRAADPEYRREVARKGPARALQFTAARTARGYVEVFRNALGG